MGASHRPPPPPPHHGANQEQSIRGREPAADARERSSAAGARATVSQESRGEGASPSRLVPGALLWDCEEGDTE